MPALEEYEEYLEVLAEIPDEFLMNKEYTLLCRVDGNFVALMEVDDQLIDYKVILIGRWTVWYKRIPMNIDLFTDSMVLIIGWHTYSNIQSAITAWRSDV